MNLPQKLGTKIAFGSTILAALAGAGSLFLDINSNSSEKKTTSVTRITTTGKDSPVVSGANGDVTINFTGEKNDVEKTN